MSGEFQNGLCSCCEDFGTCALTYFCYCYVAGKNAEATGDSCCLWGFFSVTPCGIISRTLTRGKIREKYGIQGTGCEDLMTHWCCPFCSLVQESREIKHHGDAAPGGSVMARE